MKVKIWLSRARRSKQMMLSAAGAAVLTLEASFGLLQPLLPVNVYQALSVVLLVGAAVIRTYTTVPFKDK